jgi:hypothetical protein
MVFGDLLVPAHVCTSHRAIPGPEPLLARVLRQVDRACSAPTQSRHGTSGPDLTFARCSRRKRVSIAIESAAHVCTPRSKDHTVPSLLALAFCVRSIARAARPRRAATSPADRTSRLRAVPRRERASIATASAAHVCRPRRGTTRSRASSRSRSTSGRSRVQRAHAEPPWQQRTGPNLPLFLASNAYR